MRRSRNRLNVLAKRCDQCLFSEAKIVGEERKAELLEGCNRDGGYFVCHKAILAARDDVCCRGFYDARSSLVVRLAMVLDLAVFVKEEDL